MIKIDIIGSCTLNDVFFLSKEARNKYSVNMFFQCNPPTTLGYCKLSDMIKIPISLKDFKNNEKMWYNWFKINSEQHMFDIIRSKKSIYLLVNLSETRSRYLEKMENGKVCRIFCQRPLITNKLIEKYFYTFELKSPIDYGAKYFYNDIDHYCDNLLQFYNEENIIFVENYPATKYFDPKTKTITDFKNNTNCKNYLNELNYRFIHNIKNCNIIKLPENILADKYHIWGLSSGHYIKSAYEYIGKCIDNIISRKEKNYQNILYNCLKNENEDLIDKFYCKMNKKYEIFCQRFSLLRLDIKYKNSKNTKIKNLTVIPTPLKVSEPKWFQNNGQGIVISSINGLMDISFSCEENGKLIFTIRGLDARDKNNNKYQVFINCYKFIINQIDIISDSKNVSHDNYLVHRMLVNKDDSINIKLAWRPYNFVDN